MKRLTSALIIVCFTLWFSTAQADDPVSQTDILAKRGKGVVTQDAFYARANKIPADIRLATLRDKNRLRDVINTMLLRAQIAADAIEAGYDKEPVIIERMRLAAETELAEAWMQHYLDIQPAADYEQLARENFQLNQEKMLSSPKIDVSHILLSTAERSDAEAKVLADSIYQQLQKDPSSFDQLVLEYSEDPSATSNKGKFKGIKEGDMVKAFEKTAFALEPNEISAPVRTEYGYHIIRLDAHIAPVHMSFEAVRERLVERERQFHEERIKSDYLSSLNTLDVEMTEDALRELVRRLFGDDYTEVQDEGAESS